MRAGALEAKYDGDHLNRRTQQPHKTARHLENIRRLRLPGGDEIAPRSELAERFNLSILLRHHLHSVLRLSTNFQEHPTANVTIGKAVGITQTKTEQKRLNPEFFLGPLFRVMIVATIPDRCLGRGRLPEKNDKTFDQSRLLR